MYYFKNSRKKITIDSLKSSRYMYILPFLKAKFNTFIYHNYVAIDLVDFWEWDIASYTYKVHL